MKLAANHDKFILKRMRRQSKIDSSKRRIHHYFLNALPASFLFFNFSNNLSYVVLQANEIQ